MIMSVIPERPASADSAERAHRAYLREIDYSTSVMNGEVLRRTATKEMQKQKSLKLKNGVSIAEKDGEEDENGMTLPLPLAKKLGGTASNMNIMEGNLSHREEDFQAALYYKYVECQYLISVLKNKAV
jgi:hypothetical protein